MFGELEYHAKQNVCMILIARDITIDVDDRWQVSLTHLLTTSNYRGFVGVVNQQRQYVFNKQPVLEPQSTT